MYAGQPEKYISTVFTFGDKGKLTAAASGLTRSLTAPGGATVSATEFDLVLPTSGTLKNLYWSAYQSTLTKPGNKITVYVNGSPTTLEAIWAGGGPPFIKSGSKTGIDIPVAAGDTLSVYLQLASGQSAKYLQIPSVSVELEIDAQNPNPWDLTGPVVSYVGGNVGIGTASPAGELHVTNAAIGGIAGVFETPTGKILSGTDGVLEKFSVDASGNLYASGKVGIGNTTPATELDVNGTVQMQGFSLPTGPATTGTANGLVLTSDANGVGSWQPTGGAGGTIDAASVTTINAIPKFTGPTTLGDSTIFDNGGAVGIGTDTPQATLDVQGSIITTGNVGIGTTTPRDALDIGGASSPASSFGIGFGKMKSQVTSVPANTPTAVYSSGAGELIGTLYIFIGGGGNSTMSEYRLITNSNGADHTAKLVLVDSLSRGSPPFFFDEPLLSNLGSSGAINVIMRFNTATTVRAVFVGLENHW